MAPFDSEIPAQRVRTISPLPSSRTPLPASVGAGTSNSVVDPSPTWIRIAGWKLAPGPCGATNRAMRRRHKLAEAAIAQLGAMMPDAFAGDAHALRFAARCSVQREIQKLIDCAQNYAPIVTRL